MSIKKIIIIFLFNCFFSAMVFAHGPGFSIALESTELVDALRYITKILDMNVLISSSVKGNVALYLDHVAPNDAFNMLLAAHGLGKMRVGTLWFIAPQAELIKFRQEELKWQEIKEATTPLENAVWQIQYAKVTDLAKILKDDHVSFLSKKGRIHVDARTNKLCVQDTRLRLEAIQKMVLALDIPVQQISIAARLVSIDSDCERELGIQFSVGANEEKGRYSLAVAKLADGSLLDVKLAALENQGNAELISSPGLFTANQQMASIESGEEVPYQEVSESGGTAVVFKKAVLGLKVVPQVLPKGNILLKLQINQDRPNKKMIQGMPTISTRQMNTNVLVKSGQTVVLGGIYEVNTENGEADVPFLSRIPGLGILFRQKNYRHNKRELLIFVTPTIIE